MANPSTKPVNCVVSSNWWPRQLEWRGPHSGAGQRPIMVHDLAWKVAAMMEGHGQRPHSPVLFCFTPQTHAHCPSIAYWITSNHSIKVTWRSHNWATGLDNGRCVVVRGKFQNKMSEMLALWQTSQSLAAISFVWRQLGKAPSWI